MQHNVDIDINLWPYKDEFHLTLDPNTINCKLTIKEIYLNVCKVQVNKYWISGHMAGLEISKGKYPLQKTVMVTKFCQEDHLESHLRILSKDWFLLK